MARIGLKNFKYGKLTEGTKNTYATPAVLAGAIESKVSLDINEASLYSDDILKEQDSSFKKGTLTLGVDDDDDAVFAELLGQSATEKEVGSGDTKESIKEYTSNSSNNAEYVGFGHIVTKMINGVRKYKVEFFHKVKFKPFIADAKTKGESLEFTTPSVEGTIMTLANGDWEKHATFSNEENAKTYLDSLFVQE